MNKDKKTKKLNPLYFLIGFYLVVIIISFILSVLGLDTQKTIISGNSLITTVETVKNPFTLEGIKFIFSNVFTNLNVITPIMAIILGLSAVSITEKSGLLGHFASYFSKLKPSVNIFLTVVIGVILSFFGIYSYAFLLPFAYYFYKHLNQKPILGIIIMFLSITLGTASGFIVDFNNVLLGMITESSATIDIDKAYKYRDLSTIFISLSSVLIIIFSLTMAISKFVEPKIEKEEKVEISKSKEGMFFSTLIFGSLILVLLYLVLPIKLPFAGIMLENGENYVERLLNPDGFFYNSFGVIIVIIVFIVAGTYGIISKNISCFNCLIKSTYEDFKKVPTLLPILFIYSQIVAIINWTGTGEFIVNKLTSFMSTLQFSGLPLIIMFFILTIIATILIPSIITKWSLFSPTIVPLFMRANITPEFTQFIYIAADGIGKTLSPIFIYFLYLIAILNKDEEIGIWKIIKMILPVILIVAGMWLLILIAWFVIGIPLGIGSYTII